MSHVKMSHVAVFVVAIMLKVVTSDQQYLGPLYNVVVQYYPWFKFNFLLFWGMDMYDNEFEIKENKI